MVYNPWQEVRRTKDKRTAYELRNFYTTRSNANFRIRQEGEWYIVERATDTELRGSKFGIFGA